MVVSAEACLADRSQAIELVGQLAYIRPMNQPKHHTSHKTVQSGSEFYAEKILTSAPKSVTDTGFLTQERLEWLLGYPLSLVDKLRNRKAAQVASQVKEAEQAESKQQKIGELHSKIY